MTKAQLQDLIDELYTNLEKAMDEYAHAPAKMRAKIVHRLYTLGMMLEKYNKKHSKKQMNRIIRKSHEWTC